MKFIIKLVVLVLLLNIITFKANAKATLSYDDIVGSDVVTGIIAKDTANFQMGELVEVIKGEKQKFYYVRSLSTNKLAWVKSSEIAIASQQNIEIEGLDKEIIENYINNKNFKTPSKYLIWVDLLRQNTHVFIKERDGYKLIKTMQCSTGLNTAPTPKGIFRISARGKWFYSNFYRQGAKHWVRFSGPYLFHSVPMDKQGKVVDNTLGKKASHGCVRLSINDSYWIYKNMPNGTIVYIN
ncbi:L,D-transpeptidase [Caloramator sp. CAR-1]|uniref:L,D-transpeptidase n=1 Tax=Caloramator sp. CAR-1 TaxID=3062777 RepID=UPI0026E18166|nr:L,D-transpeptidase [Caloramator sp. CAR-1]MDO6355506.1 L,D-transpeptidase [Caloramator sp. CAR-1]